MMLIQCQACGSSIDAEQACCPQCSYPVSFQDRIRASQAQEKAAPAAAQAAVIQPTAEVVALQKTKNQLFWVYGLLFFTLATVFLFYGSVLFLMGYMAAYLLYITMDKTSVKNTWLATHIEYMRLTLKATLVWSVVALLLFWIPPVAGLMLAVVLLRLCYRVVRGFIKLYKAESTFN